MKKLTLEEISKNPNTKILIFQTPTDYAYNENGINFVKKNFAIKNVTGSQLDDIRFAAGEMISNAVMHGNKRDSDKKIEIYCLWVEKNFYFVIKDEGKGFEIDNPLYGVICPPEGSLGIELTKSKMNLVYNFKDSASYICKKI